MLVFRSSQLFEVGPPCRGNYHKAGLKAALLQELSKPSILNDAAAATQEKTKDAKRAQHSAGKHRRAKERTQENERAQDRPGQLRIFLKGHAGADKPKQHES